MNLKAKSLLAAVLAVGMLVPAVTTAQATPTIEYTLQGVVPAPYNAGGSIYCSWGTGQVMDVDADGTHLIVSDATAYNYCEGDPADNRIFTSSDSGETWTVAEVPDAAWGTVAISATGQYMAAISRNWYDTTDLDFIYVSNDYGVTWTRTFETAVGETDINWWDIEMTADGQYMIATADHNGVPYISKDFGATWAPLTGFATGSWRDVGLSNDGSTVAICNNNSSTPDIAEIFVATNATISQLQFSDFDEQLSRGDGICGPTEVSGDGKTLAANTYTDATSGSVYIWKNHGTGWADPIINLRDDFRTYANGVSLSDDGLVIAIGGWEGIGDEITLDGGVTWIELQRDENAKNQGLVAVSRDGTALFNSTDEGMKRASLVFTEEPTAEPTPTPTPTLDTAKYRNAKATFNIVAGGAKVKVTNQRGAKIKIYLNGTLKSTQVINSNNYEKLFKARNLPGRKLKVTLNDITVSALSKKLK